MLKNVQVKLASVFPDPVEYDEICAEIGETIDEPKLALKAFKDGKLVLYINYDYLEFEGYSS